MSDLDTLYDRNEGFARTFDQGDLPILPRRPTIVLTCVDSRVDPAHFLGLELGDTLVLRNSGGRVTDDVEQGVALLSGMTRLVAGDRAPRLSLAIVHHTDCGLERIAAPGPRQAEYWSRAQGARDAGRRCCDAVFDNLSTMEILE